MPQGPAPGGQPALPCLQRPWSAAVSSLSTTVAGAAAQFVPGTDYTGGRAFITKRTAQLNVTCNSMLAQLWQSLDMPGGTSATKERALDGDSPPPGHDAFAFDAQIQDIIQMSALLKRGYEDTDGSDLQDPVHTKLTSKVSVVGALKRQMSRVTMKRLPTLGASLRSEATWTTESSSSPPSPRRSKNTCVARMEDLRADSELRAELQRSVRSHLSARRADIIRRNVAGVEAHTLSSKQAAARCRSEHSREREKAVRAKFIAVALQKRSNQRTALEQKEALRQQQLHEQLEAPIRAARQMQLQTMVTVAASYMAVLKAMGQRHSSVSKFGYFVQRLLPQSPSSAPQILFPPDQPAQEPPKATPSPCSREETTPSSRASSPTGSPEQQQGLALIVHFLRAQRLLARHLAKVRGLKQTVEHLQGGWRNWAVMRDAKLVLWSLQWQRLEQQLSEHTAMPIVLSFGEGGPRVTPVPPHKPRSPAPMFHSYGPGSPLSLALKSPKPKSAARRMKAATVAVMATTQGAPPQSPAKSPLPFSPAKSPLSLPLPKQQMQIPDCDIHIRHKILKQLYYAKRRQFLSNVAQWMEEIREWTHAQSVYQSVSNSVQPDNSEPCKPHMCNLLPWSELLDLVLRERERMTAELHAAVRRKLGQQTAELDAAVPRLRSSSPAVIPPEPLAPTIKTPTSGSECVATSKPSPSPAPPSTTSNHGGNKRGTRFSLLVSLLPELQAPGI
mmetsp:Transcript_100898/g.174268  ORF Transcript_100898/g.174268 Transcript_100898/m.174268 type:complete len:729 (-) Transcript_100898:1001-3187(-)